MRGELRSTASKIRTEWFAELALDQRETVLDGDLHRFINGVISKMSAFSRAGRGISGHICTQGDSSLRLKNGSARNDASGKGTERPTKNKRSSDPSIAAPMAYALPQGTRRK